MTRPETPQRPRRRRTAYVILAAIVIFVGLATRRSPQWFPPFIATYGGDTLWALTAFLTLGFLFPRRPSWQIAAAAALFSLAVELSQLYDAAWFNNIRATRLGRLVLGYGFLWSDLVCYAAGISMGWLIERFGLLRSE